MAHRLAPEARDDLDDIWDYIAVQSGSEAIADRQITIITGRFYLLARNPHLERGRDDDLGPGRRSFPAEQHVIIDRIVGADVLILRVVHGRRDIEALFGWKDG